MTRRCYYCGPVIRSATTWINDRPSCSSCAKEKISKPGDLKIGKPVADRRMALGCVL